MADELLNAVVRLEAEIQRQLDAEQKRADAWLDAVRQELAEEQQLAAERNDAAGRQQLQAAEAEAEEQAVLLVEKQRRYCRSLEEIDDEALFEVLRKELVKVLPGQSDDHQNGES